MYLLPTLDYKNWVYYLRNKPIKSTLNDEEPVLPSYATFKSKQKAGKSRAGRAKKKAGKAGSLFEKYGLTSTSSDSLKIGE